MTDPRISTVVRLHDDARVHHFAHMQLDVRVLVSTDETGGAQSVTEFAFRAPFAGPPLHWHRSYAETFVCLEGQFTLVLEDTEREMRSGDVAYVPPSTVHTYRVATDTPTRYLLICSPGATSNPMWPMPPRMRPRRSRAESHSMNGSCRTFAAVTKPTRPASHASRR